MAHARMVRGLRKLFLGKRFAPTLLVGGGLAGLGLCALVSCSKSDEPPASGAPANPTPPAADTGVDVEPGDGFGDATTPEPKEAGVSTCVSIKPQAISAKRPVDIIFAIDNSDSMAAEIDQVEAQINTNFANIIEQSGVDFRVIMLSRHGAHQDPVDPNDPLQRICVKGPLSGTTCSPIPTKPSETAKFVHHNIVVNSTDAWCKILQTFNGADEDGSHPQGWSAYLRQNAFKVFTVITDDRVNVSCNGQNFDDKFDDPVWGTTVAGAFDSALVALSPKHFGTAAHRNYVWHSIIGVAPYDTSNLAASYPSSAPISTACCGGACGTTAVAPATGHQALSKLTGGLRYPTCGLDYTTIFQAIAAGVVERATITCDYAMPANPAGQTVDPSTAVVRYTSGTNVVDFQQVPNADACVPDKFYIEGSQIRLCRETCDTVQADENAQIEVRFSCKSNETPAVPK